MNVCVRFILLIFTFTITLVQRIEAAMVEQMKKNTKKKSNVINWKSTKKKEKPTCYSHTLCDGQQKCDTTGVLGWKFRGKGFYVPLIFFPHSGVHLDWQLSRKYCQTSSSQTRWMNPVIGRCFSLMQFVLILHGTTCLFVLSYTSTFFLNCVTVQSLCLLFFSSQN